MARLACLKKPVTTPASEDSPHPRAPHGCQPRLEWGGASEGQEVHEGKFHVSQAETMHWILPDPPVRQLPQSEPPRAALTLAHAFGQIATNCSTSEELTGMQHPLAWSSEPVGLTTSQASRLAGSGSGLEHALLRVESGALSCHRSPFAAPAVNSPWLRLIMRLHGTYPKVRSAALARPSRGPVRASLQPQLPREHRYPESWRLLTSFHCFRLKSLGSWRHGPASRMLPDRRGLVSASDQYELHLHRKGRHATRLFSSSSKELRHQRLVGFLQVPHSELPLAVVTPRQQPRRVHSFKTHACPVSTTTGFAEMPTSLQRSTRSRRLTQPQCRSWKGEV